MLTIQDLRNYLDTLGMEDIAGVACDSNECPLARAATRVYGEPYAVTELRVFPVNNPEKEQATPPELLKFVSAVDKLPYFAAVTRQDVEKILEELEHEGL